MTPDELIKAFKQEFAKVGKKGKGNRRFSAGLLLSFTDLIKAVRPAATLYPSSYAFFADFPLKTEDAQGQKINQLSVLVSAEGTQRVVSSRPFYNKAQKFFRNDNKRFDYPNAPGHATGQWHQYVSWLNSLVGFSDEQLDGIASQVREHVLAELPTWEFDVTGLLAPPPRPFDLLLENLRTFKKPPGAAFQGASYAFMRADAPHLNLDIAKVQAGSARLNRVGDIDGWSGEKLAQSVEAKGYEIEEEDTDQFDKFAHDVGKRQSMGIVIAESFSGTAREKLAEKGLLTMDLVEMQKVDFRMWDLLKQDIALQAFDYYVHHVEKHSGLKKQLVKFRQTFIDVGNAKTDATPDDALLGNQPAEATT